MSHIVYLIEVGQRFWEGGEADSFSLIHSTIRTDKGYEVCGKHSGYINNALFNDKVFQAFQFELQRLEASIPDIVATLTCCTVAPSLPAPIAIMAGFNSLVVF